MYEKVVFDWGLNTTEAVSADYDGDRLVDPALYDENAGLWGALLSGSEYAELMTSFGGPGCYPVVGDFDGDGKADLTVYRENTGEWITRLSGNFYQPMTTTLGGPGYLPSPGDYDGDGICDAAVYSPSLNKWYIWWPAEQDVTDTNLLAEMFAAAVLDAHQPAASKISKKLTPIAAYNTNLVWSNGLVLVASFTRTFDYPEHIGGLYTNKYAESWVTAVPELRHYLAGYTGTNYLLRVKQALGMPHTAGNDMIAEFWVNPQSLFRPSPDPETTDCEAALDFSYTNSARLAVSENHCSWFTNQVAVNQWPWTRLGYTYDWARPRNIKGPSEFVIPLNSVFIVKSITDAETYILYGPGN
ncbi:MAG: VCBS repeat-containing protein [Kiritimatiellae bacterium]|nr:VCBS repeat-containing protein [Kiritimatiellia bacterium]